MKGRRGLPLDKVIVFYPGQFIDRKNQVFAIDGILASKNADQIHIGLMGDVLTLGKLREKYSTFENVQFTENITNANNYLQAGDLYISASKSEGMPNGVLEAMASGLTMLLSDISQHLEILEVRDGYGLSYERKDEDNFIGQLDSIIDNDLHEMGAIASKTAKEELSAIQMSKRYQKLYLKLIEKRQ